MNPLELLIVAVLVLLATAYLVYSAVVKCRRRPSLPCAGCSCGKSDAVSAKPRVDRTLLPSPRSRK